MIACLRRSRVGEKPIGLEQPDAEDERERDATLRRPHDARLRLERADRVFEGLQPLGADEIALVEQNDVAVTELVAGSLALELLEAKASGIGNRDDRIDAHPRTWVTSGPTRFRRE